MSKRKPAVSKPRSRKIAVKAQRANHDVVKSPKSSPKLRSVAAAFTKSPRELPAPIATPAPVLKETAPAALKVFDFSSASAMVRAYQANLLDMAQANMQFTLEFAQRFAAIKSPDEFRSVIAEFTSKRVAMFQKHSKEMVEMVTARAA